MYTDPRFGFTVLYPADFGAGPTNLKDSGREWLGDSDGAITVRAFGQNNPGVTIEQEQATRLHGMVERYARIRGDVLTLSAYVDGGKGIVYIREVVGRGSMNILEWTYPTDQKATWDASVTLSAHTFVPGDLSVSH